MRAIVSLALCASLGRLADAVPIPTKKAAALSLAHESVSLLQTSSEGVFDTKFIPGQPSWVHGEPGNPAPHGHMLTDTELHPIGSIACLEAKQIDPTVNCSTSLPLAMQGPMVPLHLNAGSYPQWKDPRCHSNGEYFCDPDQLLSTDERANLTATMKKLREGKHQITCGPQLQHDPVDKWHYEPFYLGVAIAKDWPLHESDDQSLQSFGRILAGRWNMTFSWDGNSGGARCPNEAMLIILPDKRQAHLSAASCMFVCESKGGPEVALATMLGLDSQGLAGGVSAGMSEVYKAIAKSSPMHKAGSEPVEETAGTFGAWNNAPAVAGLAGAGSVEESFWNWAQRIVFLMSVVILVGSLVVALLVCYLAPGLAKELNKSVV